MGVLVFIMAFLPLGGAQNMHIMKAESPGPSVSKLVPKIRTTAAILYSIYIFMTVLQISLLMIFDVSFFEALNIALSTAGTGGFGIMNNSMESYSSIVQIITAVFMFLFSINFSSYYLAMKGKFKDAVNSELRAFVIIVAVAITILTVDVMSAQIYSSLGEAIKHTSFTVSSIISTTGFSTTNFSAWPELSRTIIVLVMFIGACAGSTGGGMKVSRIIILVKGFIREIGSIIHPKQVKKITLDKKPVDHEVVRSVNAYIACYAVIFVASLILISFDERDLITNFTSVTSAINNVGAGIDGIGPYSSEGFAAFSPFSKLVLTFDMIAGRLELFPMLVLFNPFIYRKKKS
jgi:trk system potassium uptake protein TrkH